MEKPKPKNINNEDSKKSNILFNYVSCIKIDGVPILPPLLSEKDREEMRYYRQLAINVQNRLKKFKDLYLTDYSSGETDIPDDNFSTTESTDNYFTDISYEDSIAKFSESCQKDILSMLEDEKTKTNIIDSSNDTSNDITPISDIPINVPLKNINNQQMFKNDNQKNNNLESSDENYATANETLDCDKTPHKLIRSNSFILENPSPLLIAQIEQQKLLSQKNSPPKRKTWDTSFQSDLFSQRSSEDNILSCGDSEIFNIKSDNKRRNWFQIKRRSFDDQKRLKSAPNFNKKTPIHKRKGWDLSNAKEKWNSIENDIGKTKYKITKKFNSLPSSTTTSPNEKMFISRKKIGEKESKVEIKNPPNLARTPRNVVRTPPSVVKNSPNVINPPLVKTPPNLIKTPDITKNVPKRLLIMSTPKKNLSNYETKKIKGFVTPVRTIQDLNNIPSREYSPKRARSAPRNFYISKNDNNKTTFTIKNREFLVMENDRDMGDSLKIGHGIHKIGSGVIDKVPGTDKICSGIDKFGSGIDKVPGIKNIGSGIDHFGTGTNKIGSGTNKIGPEFDKVCGFNKIGSEVDKVPGIENIDSGITYFGPAMDIIGSGNDNFSPGTNKICSGTNKIEPEIDEIPGINKSNSEIENFSPGINNFDPGIHKIDPGTHKIGPETHKIGPGIHKFNFETDKTLLEIDKIYPESPIFPGNEIGGSLRTLENINRILTPECESPISNLNISSENNELKCLFVKIQEIQKQQMDELLQKQKREQEIFLQKFAEQQTLLLKKITKNYSSPENQSMTSTQQNSYIENEKETDDIEKTDLFESSKNLLTECKRLLAPPKKNCDIQPFRESSLYSFNSTDTLNDPNLTLRTDTDQSLDEITIKYKTSPSIVNNDLHIVTSAEFRRSVSSDSLETEAFLTNSYFNGETIIAKVEKNIMVKVDQRGVGEGKRGVSRELFPSSEQIKAATVICAAARGYLIRRLLKTEKVQTLIQTIKDTLICAMELHHESVENIQPADIELHRRLIQQVTAACVSFHDIFFKLSTKEQMSVIFHNRERLKEKLLRPVSARSSASSLSATTQKVLERKHRRETNIDFGTHSNRSSFSRSSRGQGLEAIRPRTRSAGPIDSQQFKKTPPNSQENSLRKSVGIGANNKKPWR